MKHENIVRMLDIFEDNRTAYYVMEYIDGKSLKISQKNVELYLNFSSYGYLCSRSKISQIAHRHSPF